MSIGKIMQNVAMPNIGSINTSKELGSSQGSSSLEKFEDVVAKGISTVNGNIKQFESMSEQFAKGDKVSLQELMLSGEHADISLKLMTTMRNKILEAYQEVMRLPV